MFQIKKQGKTSAKELNLTDQEFKMFIKMLTNLGIRLDEHTENFNK